MYKMVFLAEDELEGNQFQMCLQVGWAMDSQHGSLITGLEKRVVISKKMLDKLHYYKGKNGIGFSSAGVWCA